VRNLFYRNEAERGYEAYGNLWSPGYFSTPLEPGQEVTLVASTEPWTTILALQVDAAQTAERIRVGSSFSPLPTRMLKRTRRQSWC
jgi:Glycogen debranching enzyme N terminal